MKGNDRQSKTVSGPALIPNPPGLAPAVAVRSRELVKPILTVPPVFRPIPAVPTLPSQVVLAKMSPAQPALSAALALSRSAGLIQRSASSAAPAKKPFKLNPRANPFPELHIGSVPTPATAPGLPTTSASPATVQSLPTTSASPATVSSLPTTSARPAPLPSISAPSVSSSSSSSSSSGTSSVHTSSLSTVRADLDSLWQTSKANWLKEVAIAITSHELNTYKRDDQGRLAMTQADFASLEREWTSRIEAGYSFRVIRSLSYTSQFKLMDFLANSTTTSRHSAIFNYHIHVI